MHFAQPLWIIVGLAVCLLVFMVNRKLGRGRELALQQFAARALLGKLTINVSEKKRRIKQILMLAGIFCCFLALARPQYGHHWIDVKRKGIDILFAIDTSLSMRAQDIQPNRLERAKFAVLDFIAQLDGDRVGLLPFAGSAFLMCPLTVDYGAFEQSLQSIDPGIIPEPGTNLARAIIKAEEILHNDANHKILIIVTDGENLQGSVSEAAALAAEKNMTIFTVGVGTQKGELIPVDMDGAGNFIKDDSGKFVVSKLDEENLRAIAEQTGGLYVPLGNQGQGLETIYQEKLVRIPKTEVAEKRQKIPIDRFPWFLAIALILFIVEYLLNSRKTPPVSFRLPSILKRTLMVAIMFFPLGILLLPPSSNASPGEEAYAQKEYEKAEQYYREALEKETESPPLHYNMGAVAYRQGDYNEAISRFNQALQSDDLDLQKKTYYNLGNAHFRNGEKMLKNNTQKTREQWQEALTAYSSALKLSADHKEARFNYDYVEKKLKELEQQQQGGQGSSEQNQDKEQSQQEKDKDGEQQPQNREQTSPEQEDQQGEQQEQEQEQKQQQDQQQNQQPDAREDEQEEAQEQKEGATGPMRQMSQEEARQLLKEMQNEEGTLNFLPQHDQDNDISGGKNW